YGPLFAVPGRGSGELSRLMPVSDTSFVLGTTPTIGDVLFDADTGKVATGWPAARAGDAVTAAPSRDGTIVAVGSKVRPIQRWDTETGTLGKPFEASLGFHRLAFTPDGSELTGLGALGRIRVWDAQTGRVVRDVDHDYAGTLDDLVALGDNLAAIA